MKSTKIFITALSTLLITATSQACDLCAVYDSIESNKLKAQDLKLGLYEQFTSYGKLQQNSKYIENENNQHMESSITQIFAEYAVSDRASLQLNLPYINRDFKRVYNEAIDEGTESGIGDLSLIAKYTPYRYEEDQDVIALQVFAGIELPTGDVSRLGENGSLAHSAEHEVTTENSSEEHGDSHSDKSADHHRFFNRHNGKIHESSALHGHDLALGSGSFDFPLGISFLAQSGRTLAQGSLQYTFRNEGSYDYKYADDLIWEVGPAYYLSLDEDFSVALKANLSGEYKRKDEWQNQPEAGTYRRASFYGPELLVSSGNWDGELAWDIPLDINNSDVQAVTDYRLRASLSYRF